jgi:hypothetical protein
MTKPNKIDNCFKCPINRDCEEKELYDIGEVDCYFGNGPLGYAPHSDAYSEAVEQIECFDPNWD